MCIAIAKPHGIAIPSKKILETCWKNNPDGAGFAFNDNGKVVIHKGFMDFTSFYTDFEQCNKIYNFKNRGVLIHFRIATHGAVNGAMTHPFPIHADEGALSKPVFRSNYAVIHNGIISLTSSNAQKSQGLSDTAIFIRDYLEKIARNKKWFTNEANISLIEQLIESSKMAILRWDGQIIKTKGFHDKDGIFYSNTSYTDEWGCRSLYSGYYSNCYNYDFGYDKSYGKKYHGTKFLAHEQKIPLMAITEGETLQTPEYSQTMEENDCYYYIDDKGYIYTATYEIDDTFNGLLSTSAETVMEDTIFYKFDYTGTVLDITGFAKPFKADVWVNESDIIEAYDD